MKPTQLQLRRLGSFEPYINLAARLGDPVALCAWADRIAEEDVMDSPFEPGSRYLFETRNHYFCAQVARVGFGWVVLECATRVDVICLANLEKILRIQDFTSPELERVCLMHHGRMVIMIDQIHYAYSWFGPLPTSSRLVVMDDGPEEVDLSEDLVHGDPDNMGFSLDGSGFVPFDEMQPCYPREMP